MYKRKLRLQNPKAATAFFEQILDHLQQDYLTRENKLRLRALSAYSTSNLNDAVYIYSVEFPTEASNFNDALLAVLDEINEELLFNHYEECMRRFPYDSILSTITSELPTRYDRN